MSQRIFFDTNICNRIAYHNLVREGDLIRKHVSSTYEYVISPLTFIELLIKIGRGDEAYFEKNRRALEMLLAGQAKPIFLDFPGSYLLNHLFAAPQIAKFGPKDFQLWIKVVLEAPNQAALRDGEVEIGHDHLVFGLDFGIVEAETQKGKDEHRRVLEGFRDEDNSPASAPAWAAATLARLGRQPNREDSIRVATALDAAYRFDEYLWRQVRNRSYDLHKNDSDWIDRQQLYYMCDERIVFVTDDANVLQAAQKSPQGSRVVPFDALLRSAESNAFPAV
ncbi:MAG: hypothetical protein HYX89_03230 [Chloroflexi bacterium]|nr:hypothetical protein [Chloroflexota bacterium]